MGCTTFLLSSSSSKRHYALPIHFLMLVLINGPILLSFHCIVFLPTVVEVGIEHNSYTVMEGAGSLDICVTVQNNSIVLGTNLTLQLRSITGTAQGIYAL